MKDSDTFRDQKEENTMSINGEFIDLKEREKTASSQRFHEYN